MHMRGLCRHAVSVCLSRSWVASKRLKISSKIFHSGSQAILVFPCQTGWRYSDGNPHNGGVECRWGRQKTRFWTNIWLRCIQVYSIINRTSREVWKNKAATNGGKRRAEHLPQRPSSVVRIRRRRSVYDGLDVIIYTSLFIMFYDRKNWTKSTAEINTQKRKK